MILRGKIVRREYNPVSKATILIDESGRNLYFKPLTNTDNFIAIIYNKLIDIERKIEKLENINK